jgi:hypothetical protein
MYTKGELRDSETRDSNATHSIAGGKDFIRIRDSGSKKGRTSGMSSKTKKHGRKSFDPSISYISSS